MKKSMMYKFAGLALIIAAVVIAGCSLIFWGIGSALDSPSKYNRQHLKGWELYKIPEGANLKVVTKGKTYSGVFAGTARQNPQQDTIDNILLIQSSRKKDHGDTQRVLVQEIKKINTVVKRRRTVVPVSQIAAVEYGERLEIYHQHKNKPARGYYRGIQFEGKKKIPNSVLIVTGSNPNAIFKSAKNILLSEIDSVIIPEKKTNVASAFLTVGITTDILIVVSVIALSTIDLGLDWNFTTPSTPPSEGGSCPYVYSFDGQSYHRDAEIFGGAVFPAAQRSDWDNLDYLKPDESGVCRLELTNELEETQYVDALQLLVADHPKGMEVYPSFEGKLYNVSAPQPPVTAVTSSGDNIRESLRKKDGDYWLSSPFNRNPNNPADLRDGVVLEFSRPPGSNSAVLVFNVMNTIWAAEMQRQVLNLMGSDLPEWYEKLNVSSADRQLMHDAMVREGMLLVSIWDGKNWRPAGHVWEVGSAIPKDIALETDLTGIPGDILRVRLDCPPGVWMLDRVEADFSYSTGASGVQTIMPWKATDEKGLDITAALNNTDHQYFIMPDTKVRATVEYRMPEGPAKGFERTFILQSSGYYTVHCKNEAKPQPALFRQLLETPGAYDRYVLEQLNAAMKEIMSGSNERKQEKG